MPLNNKDLQSIKDIVEFSIEKSEIKVIGRIKELEVGLTKIDKDLNGFREEMSQEISDIAEMNREFLTRADNHETRISKLELKTDLATK